MKHNFSEESQLDNRPRRGIHFLRDRVGFFPKEPHARKKNQAQTK